MLSDPSVRLVASNFIAVKVDPRSSRDALEHKTTRYVPELVVLDPSQNLIASIDARDPQGVRDELANALAAASRRRSGR